MFSVDNLIFVCSVLMYNLFNDELSVSVGFVLFINQMGPIIGKLIVYLSSNIYVWKNDIVFPYNSHCIRRCTHVDTFGVTLVATTMIQATNEYLVSMKSITPCADVNIFCAQLLSLYTTHKEFGVGTWKLKVVTKVVDS